MSPRKVDDLLIITVNASLNDIGPRSDPWLESVRLVWQPKASPYWPYFYLLHFALDRFCFRVALSRHKSASSYVDTYLKTRCYLMAFTVLITYNVLGFSTDLLFLLLVFAHAIRSRRQSHFGIPSSYAKPCFLVISRGNRRIRYGFTVAYGVRFDQVLFLVSLSFMYLCRETLIGLIRMICSALAMYVITFSAVGFRRVDAEVCIGAARCDIAGKTGLGLNTLLLLLGGNSGAQDCCCMSERNSTTVLKLAKVSQHLEARRTNTWRVARRSEQADSYVS